MDEKKELYVNLGIEIKGNEHKHAEVRVELKGGRTQEERLTEALLAYGALGQTLIKKLDMPKMALIAAIMAAEGLVGADNE